ncbi:MAG: hypothetical protein GX298_03290, partial [Planctomycetes bacterium]|nr:hypothetical protein [Planctomycetota bacterium]
MQHCERVEIGVAEEQASEPPSPLRAAEDAPSALSTRRGDKTALPEEKQHPLNAAQWSDWRWQIRNRIRTLEQLLPYVPSLGASSELPKVIARYPMAITPYYATLIERADMSDPVFRMSVPNVQELYDPPSLSDDPLEEHEDMPVPGLVHRYRDRALLIVTTMCSMYCRHCTRKRIAGTR